MYLLHLAESDFRPFDDPTQTCEDTDPGLVPAFDDLCDPLPESGALAPLFVMAMFAQLRPSPWSANPDD